MEPTASLGLTVNSRYPSISNRNYKTRKIPTNTDSTPQSMREPHDAPYTRHTIHRNTGEPYVNGQREEAVVRGHEAQLIGQRVVLSECGNEARKRVEEARILEEVQREVQVEGRLGGGGE